ncbi:MAG: OadG family protein [Clostridia bacterium]|nr:OadG family protein [Clostridia bacterium]
MFDFMLDAAQIRQVPHETVGEKLAVGGEVSLRGMLTVFAVLILIWGIVELLHLILGEKTKPAKVVEEVSAPALAEVQAEEVAPAVVPEVNAAADYDIIAVITAAVAAASGSSPNSFRVVSFKRANNKFSSGK